MNRKLVSAVLVIVASFTVAACDQTKGNAPAGGQGSVEIDFDFDTKTKTVTAQPTLTPAPYRPVTTTKRPPATTAAKPRVTR